MNTDSLYYPVVELPTFEKAPELQVSVDGTSSEVMLTCVSEGLQRTGLLYWVDWYWGSQSLARQPVSQQLDGQYISVLSEQNITRLAFGQEVGCHDDNGNGDFDNHGLLSFRQHAYQSAGMYHEMMICFIDLSHSPCFTKQVNTMIVWSGGVGGQPKCVTK